MEKKNKAKLKKMIKSINPDGGEKPTIGRDTYAKIKKHIQSK